MPWWALLILVLVLLGLAFVAFLKVCVGGVPRGRRLNYRTGIEIWEGSPGSGKSYGVTERLLSAVLYQRRVVYTNLPLRLKVVRRYLEIKGKEKASARYVRALNVDHFLRFLVRNEAFTQFREKLKASALKDSEIERRFEREYGPHVYSGEDANWFEPGAVFLLDELHRWFSQRTQDKEPAELLTYLTMHRHHLHWLIVMTQNRMQLSVPWRENAICVVHCVNKAELPFLWSIKFPLPAFSYSEYPKEMIDIHSRKIDPNIRPASHTLRVPFLNGGLIWRLYDSFTHLGNQRSLERKVRDAQKRIEGEHYREKKMPKRSTSIVWPAATVITSCLAGVCVTFAWLASYAKAEPTTGPAAKAAPLPAAVPAPPVSAASVPLATPGPDKLKEAHARGVAAAQGLPDRRENIVREMEQQVDALFPWKVTAISDDGCVVEGGYVKLNGFYHGFFLLACSAERGSTIWTNGTDSCIVAIGGGVSIRLDGIPIPDAYRPAKRSAGPTTQPTGAGGSGPDRGATTRPSTQPVGQDGH